MMTILERPIDGAVQPIDLAEALGDDKPFPRVEPFDWKGNLISIAIGGSCGLGSVLLIGFAVGYARWGMPWVHAAVEAIF